ncbi:type III pantothenate kinase [Breznakia sp. PF5-3]|uniref:type III pantothenate kinase n=1 Tax=unclassified Breznakia TaxID=2623764 RepID=UPI002406D903|nr:MULTISPECIES: type III pantothenate kinase [unclassified Breznakia]MDL2276274.1 type III pantothenate kinase [Breznakia sp. OttesenSCG-928-G09]MDF9825559.1 type III pantothenate kinase [Breznakia sp. PM6-1]MDF9835866.1 type III pantothenate kinase [Breznakia sp. PF5-3]MDF9837611.1 type III pantothenate kinase [Breznakia sp. PFB2-8]MDF9860008.1 type III pantothenate kinase [Breznakia sp. PH5-24]
MLVVVDIGNTNITIGLFRGDDLIANYRLTTLAKRTSDEYGFLITSFLNNEHIKPSDVQDVIIASVVPKIMYSFNNSIRKYFKKEPIIVGPGIKTGISIRIDNPRDLGADRLVDAVAAYYIHKGNVLVIDFGTATTFDYINEKGEFVGGVTSPGIEIGAQAMAAKAAKLPEIEIKASPGVLATNTIDSMQAGVYFGYIGHTEYIIKKFKETVSSDLKVVATGGLGRIIAENTEMIDVYDQDLTFKGLKMIYDRTKKG